MNKRFLSFPTSHGRHISESDSRHHRSVGDGSDERPIWYASASVDVSNQRFQSTDANPGYMSGPQCPFQNDDQHNYVALDISQPAYPFSNPALDNSFTGQGYEELQPVFDHHESGPQYPYQNGGGFNDAGLDMSQLGDPFFNTALDSGFMGLVHEEVQPELNYWMKSLETTPNDALVADPDPFSSILGLLDMNGTQPQLNVPSTAVPVPDSVADPALIDNSIRCDRCNRTFGRSQELRRHMRKYGSPTYKCSHFDCSKTFYRADKLRDHMRQGHKGTR